MLARHILNHVLLKDSQMRSITTFLPVGFLAAIIAIVSCSSPPVVMVRPNSGDPSMGSTATVVSGGHQSPFQFNAAKRTSELLEEVNIRQDLIRNGTHARRIYRPMKPRYITIHSTQNFSASADAYRHSLALKNGKLRAPMRRGGNRIGYLAWHYTTDQRVAVQHIPDNEQGEHADFNGPGNNYSIGIEMCENRGNSRSATIDRTAKLTAYLMKKHNIPLRNVVPHYHWPRKGLSDPHKNCPHFLLDNGRPGAKWRWFQGRVKHYYDQITVSGLQIV